MAKRDNRATKAQLPAGAFRTRLEDGSRVKEYIQYRRDLALMEKLEVKSTVDDKETVVVQPTQADATGETDDGFTGKAVELKSTTGD